MEVLSATMGNLYSRSSRWILSAVGFGPPEESDAADVALANYHYSDNGRYFGSHFLMGGLKFESPSAEAESFLFGDNADINFIATHKPALVSHYSQSPSPSEATKMLRCLVNVRRDSLKLTRMDKVSPVGKTQPAELADTSPPSTSNDDGGQLEDQGSSSTAPPPDECYELSFVIDCDVPSNVYVHFFAKEIPTVQGVEYVGQNSSAPSHRYHFGVGVNQICLTVPEQWISPAAHPAEQLRHCAEINSDVFPVVIHCVTSEIDLENGGVGRQSHVTLANIDRSAEGVGFVVKTLKQKLVDSGVCYLLQEIYGIENKHSAPISLNVRDKSENENGEEVDENDGKVLASCCDDEGSGECVVCISEKRDTLLLPCRHLCLCDTCADTLLCKASGCPICRSPFRALLHLRSLRRVKSSAGDTSSSSLLAGGGSRYEAVSLFEALNGSASLGRRQSSVDCLVPSTTPYAAPAAGQLPTTQSEPNMQRKTPHPTAARRRRHANAFASVWNRAAPSSRSRQQPVAPIQEVLTPQSIGQSLASCSSAAGESADAQSYDMVALAPSEKPTGYDTLSWANVSTTPQSTKSSESASSTKQLLSSSSSQSRPSSLDQPSKAAAEHEEAEATTAECSAESSGKLVIRV